jgi:hypothetical protein
LSSNLQIAFFAGLALAAIYIVGRTVRHGGVSWPITDLFEAITLAIAPLPVPGAVEMLGKATQKGELPILNSVESRIALGFGGALLITAIVFTAVVGLKRGWRAKGT